MNHDSTSGPFLQNPEVDDDSVEVQQGKSVWALSKDKHYRRKLIQSSWLACSLFSLWGVEAQPGVTFIDLQIITGTTGLEEASMFYTIHTVGYLIGCVISALLSKSGKIRPNVIISVGLLAMGAGAITTPYCTSYLSMMFIRGISGIPPGISEAVIFSEQMRTWQDEGKWITQLLMLVASVGLFLAPVVSEPFLAPKRNATHAAAAEDVDYKSAATTTTSTIITQSSGIQFKPATTFSPLHYLSFSENAKMDLNVSSNDSDITHQLFLLPDAPELNYETSKVHYAFLITGGFTIMTSLLFFIFFHPNGSGKKKDNPLGSNSNSKVKVNEQITYRSIPVFLKTVLILMFSLFNMFITTVGISFVSFIMTFLVKEYEDITKSQSAYFITIFFCSGFGSRLIMIFVADRILPKYLLVFFVVISLISFVLFNIAAIYGETILLAILTGVLNLSLAPILPITLTWCQGEYLEVSNLVACCITFSAALGVLSNPVLLSHIMETWGNMSFCYLHSIEALIALVSLLVILLFNKYYVNRKYGPLIVSAHHNGNRQ